MRSSRVDWSSEYRRVPSVPLANAAIQSDG